MVVTTRPRQRSLPSLEIDRPNMAYLDFAGSLRGLVLRTLIPAMKDHYEAEVAQRVAAGQPAPKGLEDVEALIGQSQGARWRGLLQYQSQQLRVRRLHELGEEQKERLAQELAIQPDDLGTVELDPDLPLPEYYSQTYFHTHPSGYYRTLAAGVTYDIGLNIYRLAAPGDASWRSEAVDAIPDGPYQDILDMACGTGSPTVALAKRWPDARITGIDLAPPLLLMAHAKLEHLGIPARLLQRDAERTGLPDGSFDLVFAQILFHEVPKDVAPRILAEALRLLRPGGLMVVADVEPYATLDPFDRYIHDWQTENNEEPFWRDYGESDYPAMLREVGYAQAWSIRIPNPMVQYRYQYLHVGRKA